MRSVYIVQFLDAINDKVFSPRKQQFLLPANSTFVIVDFSCGVGRSVQLCPKGPRSLGGGPGLLEVGGDKED